MTSNISTRIRSSLRSRVARWAAVGALVLAPAAVLPTSAAAATGWFNTCVHQHGATVCLNGYVSANANGYYFSDIRIFCSEDSPFFPPFHNTQCQSRPPVYGYWTGHAWGNYVVYDGGLANKFPTYYTFHMNLFVNSNGVVTAYDTISH